jgi:hypothetical protein
MMDEETAVSDMDEPLQEIDVDAITPEYVGAVLLETFDLDAEAIALRQAEARKAWPIYG